MADMDNTNDLATLSRLDEAILVEQLKQRYDEDKIYTYIGDILVAVNPFRFLEIYTPKHMQLYRAKTKSEAPPHIFAVADAAYHGMLGENRDQCCIVSGESGAGKTESAKFIIKQIVHLCQTGATATNLEQKILAVNPLLEAFGNAQTTMNDNSSRFGKYTELMFDAEGHVYGARISEYLLEKSRVVGQQEGEQNFHIFYYVFSSPNLAELSLSPEEQYEYLGTSGLDADIEGLYEEVIKALGDVGFAAEEQQVLFVVLAAILHLGNIKFEGKNPLDPAAVSKESEERLAVIAKLLQVKEADLMSALTQAVTFTRGETIRRKYNLQQAYDNRDAIAKTLYARIFGWIVANINQLLAPSTASASGPKTPNSRPGKVVLKPCTIGILDIFGFEHFAVNRFEQWCINLANEQLQHFFNQHVFQLELEEYAREGVNGANISYIDNKPLLDMFLGKPVGLLALLDDESLFPQGTDATCVEKFVKAFGTHKNFVPEKSNDPRFTIVHYAGRVQYTAENILDKNRDSLSPDVMSLLQSSGVTVIAEVFLGQVNATGNLVTLRATRTDSISTRGKRIEEAKKEASIQVNSANKRSPTVSTQFKNSLSLLVEKMTACRPHFVRCIKPNTMKSPWNYVDEFVMIQLNYTGMLETTRIRREGYAVRPKFSEFIERFKMLRYRTTASVAPTADSCAGILNYSKVQGWLMGKTKVFLKYFHVEELEHQVYLHNKLATVLQSCLKGSIARKKHAVLVHAAKEQKAAVEDMIERLNVLCRSFRVNVNKQNLADVARWKEMSLKQKEEARLEAQKRLREEEARRDVERKKALEMEKRVQEIQREKEAREKEMREERERAMVKVQELMKAQEELEKASRAKEQETLKVKDDYEGKIKALKDTIAEKERQIMELEQQLADSQDMLERARSENQRTLSQVKSLQSETEREIAELRRKATNAESQVNSMKAESSSATAELKRILTEKEETWERKRSDYENQLQQHEQRFSELQDKMTRKASEHTSAISALHDQIQQKEIALQSAISERQTAIRELTEKVERGEAEAEAQLRLKLRQQELKADEALGEVQRLQAKLDTQASMLELQKNEGSSLLGELKRMLGEKEEILRRRQDEYQRSNEELEAKVKQSQDAVRKVKDQYEEELTQARVQLQGKTAKLAEIEAANQENEKLVHDLRIKLDDTEAELTSRRKLLHGVQGDLEEKQAEVARFKDRLESQTTMLTTSQAQQEKVVAQLNDLLKEKQDIAEEQRRDHERAVQNLESRIQAQHEENEALVEEYRQKLNNMRAEADKQDAELQRQLLEKDEKVEGVRAELSEATKKNADLEAQLREAMDKLQQIEDEHRKANDILEQQRREKEEELSRGKAAHEQALRDMQSKMEAQEIAQKGEMNELATAIRNMGRRKVAGTSNDDKKVDLLKYMTMVLGGTPVPDGILLGRFNCKGYLERYFSAVAQKQWQKKWFVFDLNTKSLIFYNDNREFKMTSKVALELRDMTTIVQPDSQEAKETHSFLINTARRTVYLRAPSEMHLIVWMKVLSSVLLVKGAPGGASSA